VDAPRRVATRHPICCCVIGENSCPTRTSGPDEPLCDNCIEQGHPDYEGFRMVIKTSEPVTPFTIEVSLTAPRRAT
jgi:hypothetical protein